MTILFRNRDEAARKLADLLTEYKNTDSVVLAIPRGGIPIGNVIAKALNLPLDIALSKKIGHPFQKEFAIGAVSMTETIVDDSYEVSEDYIADETLKIRERLKEIYKLFKGNEEPINIKDKTVIVTDDGIATGRTMLSTIKMISKQQPASVVIAVPVISPSAFLLLNPDVDRIVALAQPTHFRAIGQFYEDFSQVTDKEIIKLLNSEK